MRAWLIRLGSTDVTVLAVAAWRWWVSELAAMIPPSWRAALQMRRSFSVVLDVSEDEVVVGRTKDGAYTELAQLSRGEVDERSIAALAAMLGSPETPAILLRLPTKQVLRRRLGLPKVAPKELGQLLVHEVERQCPLDSRLIYHDHWIVARDKAAHRLEVELRMVRRSVVDDAAGLARRLGFVPGAIVFIGDDRAAPLFRLPRSGLAGKGPRIETVWSVASVTLPAILAAAVIGVALDRNVREMDALDAKVAAAKAQAQVVEGLRREIAKTRDRIEFLPRQKQVPSAAAVLAEVTRLLPDGTWLFEFELNGRELRIRGYSPAASSLVGIFDSASLFANARFRSSLTAGPRSDLERFDLSCDLRGGAP